MRRIDAIEVEIVCCGGGTKPTDTHLVLTVHCVDDEIVAGAAHHGSEHLRPAGCDLILTATAGGEELDGFTSRQPL
jgi:hypothetical protein